MGYNISMDLAFILDFISEAAYFIGVFLIFMVIVVAKGRQAIINVIFSLYLALLISLVFPYYDTLLDTFDTAKGVASGKLIIFALFTMTFFLLANRIMPDEFKEKKFESFGKKVLLALAATSLVMVFSFQVLPITEFLTPGTPIQSLFSPENYFFWWLLAPLVILFIL